MATFLQQCISLLVSSAFNANMILGRGLILLIKYLVSLAALLHLSLAFALLVAQSVSPVRMSVASGLEIGIKSSLSDNYTESQ